MSYKGIISVFFIAIILIVSNQVFVFSADLMPKDIYGLKQKALQSLNLDELGKYITKEQFAEFKKSKDPKGMMFLVQYLSPIEYEVTGEEISGNTALLYLKGKYRNTQNEGKIEQGFGKASFKKESDGWKFDIEKWQGKPWK